MAKLIPWWKAVDQFKESFQRLDTRKTCVLIKFILPIRFTQILHKLLTKPYNFNTFRPISTPTTGTKHT